MTNRRWTILVLVALVALLIAWDVLVALEEQGIAPGQGGTISEVTLAFAQAHPVVGFLLGVLSGHLLWPQVRPESPG